MISHLEEWYNFQINNSQNFAQLSMYLEVAKLDTQRMTYFYKSE